MSMLFQQIAELTARGFTVSFAQRPNAFFQEKTDVRIRVGLREEESVGRMELYVDATDSEAVRDDAVARELRRMATTLEATRPTHA